MFQYRAVLVRLRQGDSDRDIARARLMGRPKVAALRALATQHGWLAADTLLPEDGEIAVVIGQARRARSTISTVEPFRDLVARWAEQGVGGVAIHAALCREHGYSGSYSAVRRIWARWRRRARPRPRCGCNSLRAKRHRSISAPGRSCSIPRVASCAVPGAS